MPPMLSEFAGHNTDWTTGPPNLIPAGSASVPVGNESLWHGHDPRGPDPTVNLGLLSEKDRAWVELTASRRVPFFDGLHVVDKTGRGEVLAADRDMLLPPYRPGPDNSAGNARPHHPLAIDLDTKPETFMEWVRQSGAQKVVDKLRPTDGTLSFGNQLRIKANVLGKFETEAGTRPFARYSQPALPPPFYLPLKDPLYAAVRPEADDLAQLYAAHAHTAAKQAAQSMRHAREMSKEAATVSLRANRAASEALARDSRAVWQDASGQVVARGNPDGGAGVDGAHSRSLESHDHRPIARDGDSPAAQMVSALKRAASGHRPTMAESRLAKGIVERQARWFLEHPPARV